MWYRVSNDRKLKNLETMSSIQRPIRIFSKIIESVLTNGIPLEEKSHYSGSSDFNAKRTSDRSKPSYWPFNKSDATIYLAYIVLIELIENFTFLVCLIFLRNKN